MSKAKYVPIGRDFKRYDPDKYDCIPLHMPGTKREEIRKGEAVLVKIGKQPIHGAWTSRRYDSRKVVAQCIADRRNMGIRPRDGQMVIDIDIRHGGDEGFADLCLAVGDDFEAYPTVITGGGGEHIYMTVPRGFPIQERVDAFPGIEFKGPGRQVLASGSIHPDSLRPYVFKPGSPDINELKRAPKALLRLIKATATTRAATITEGILSCEAAEAFLQHVPAEAFGEGHYNEWIALAAAVKLTTGGAAFDAWLDFCRSDPHYGDDDAAQQRAAVSWNSFKRQTGKLATVDTLLKVGAKFEVPRAIMKPIRNAAARAAFAADPIPFKELAPLSDEARQYLDSQFDGATVLKSFKRKECQQ